MAEIPHSIMYVVEFVAPGCWLWTAGDHEGIADSREAACDAATAALSTEAPDA